MSTVEPPAIVVLETQFGNFLYPETFQRDYSLRPDQFDGRAVTWLCFTEANRILNRQAVGGPIDQDNFPCGRARVDGFGAAESQFDWNQRQIQNGRDTGQSNFYRHSATESATEVPLNAATSSLPE